MARTLGNIDTSDNWTWRSVPWLLATIAGELRLCRELLTQINDEHKPVSVDASIKAFFEGEVAEDRIRAGMNAAATQGHKRGQR